MRGGTYWTTLRESVVESNEDYGIFLCGTDQDTAKIKGWWIDDLQADPNTPADVDRILAVEPRGYNCIMDNTYNVWSPLISRFDLGSEYMDGQSQMVTLGGFNSIFDPVTSQGQLDYYTYGGFREVWWNNDSHIDHYNGSVFDNLAELMADSVGCSEMGKRPAAGASRIADMIEQYRTRGGMRPQPAMSEQTTQHIPDDATCAITAVYPNPFNPVARITVTLTEAQKIRLIVTDALGREVAVLADGFRGAGTHDFTFDAGRLASGSYLAVLHGESSQSTMQLMLAK